MRTEQLIERLAEGPVPGTAPATILARALVLGTLVSFAVMLGWLQPRPDLAQAALTMAFWMKLAYAASTAALAFWLVEHLSRPTGTLARGTLFVFVPLLMILTIALIQLGDAEQSGRMHLIIGS